MTSQYPVHHQVFIEYSLEHRWIRRTPHPEHQPWQQPSPREVRRSRRGRRRAQGGHVGPDHRGARSAARAPPARCRYRMSGRRTCNGHDKKRSITPGHHLFFNVSDASPARLRTSPREVMNGCICCTVRGDLAEILKGSLADRAPGGARSVWEEGLAHVRLAQKRLRVPHLLECVTVESYG